jgi:hypothetical protein
MRNLPALALPSTAPHQLKMPFDSARLRGISRADHNIVLARLASLLLEAAGVAAGERADDEH